MTLFTLVPVDFSELDRTYGTELVGADIAVIAPVPRWLRPVLHKLFFHVRSFRPLRQHILTRFFRRRKHQFDLALSAYNEMDLGGAGLQYIHDRPGSSIGPRWLQKLSGHDGDRMGRNPTLAPSRWLAEQFRREYDREPVVLNPPVRSHFPGRSWGERTNGFVCVGRFSPEKELYRAVHVVELLRRRGHNVSLLIVSGGGKWVVEARLRALRARYPWLTIRKRPSNREYTLLLAQYRYGLNVASTEGFGISIAELINAGCLPFVRGRIGGQSEIIGRTPGLTFETDQEAVSKIEAVLAAPSEAQRLRRALQEHCNYLTLETFVDADNVQVDMLARRCAEDVDGAL